MSSNLISKSVVLAQAEILTGALASLMTNCEIAIYSGTVPANADASIGSAVLLCTITLGGTGSFNLVWDTSAPAGVMQKPSSATWEGTATAGVASFFRVIVSGDTQTVSPAAAGGYRMQGTCGNTAADAMFLTSTTLPAGTLVLNAVQLLVS